MSRCPTLVAASWPATQPGLEVDRRGWVIDEIASEGRDIDEKGREGRDRDVNLEARAA